MFEEKDRADDREFGDWLRERRLEAGLTQQELADAAGLIVRQIGDYENGRNEPRRQNLEKLRVALGLDSIPQYHRHTRNVYDEFRERFDTLDGRWIELQKRLDVLEGILEANTQALIAIERSL